MARFSPVRHFWAWTLAAFLVGAASACASGDPVFPQEPPPEDETGPTPPEEDVSFLVRDVEGLRLL